MDRNRIISKKWLLVKIMHDSTKETDMGPVMDRMMNSKRKTTLLDITSFLMGQLSLLCFNINISTPIGNKI